MFLLFSGALAEHIALVSPREMRGRASVVGQSKATFVWLFLITAYCGLYQL